MLWIYGRGQQSLRLETRLDQQTGEYVLISYHDDGSQQVERFNDATSFQNRLGALEKQLVTEQWQITGAPILLRDGWKL